MKIGMTFDLRDDYLAMGFSENETAEFDHEETILSIERELLALGHEVDRIGHVQALTRRLADGDRWDLVFNISEGLWGMGRESQVPALLDAYGIAYTFSDPLVCALTLHKGMTKHVLRSAGIATTDFVVVDSAEDLAKVNFAFPMFAKPVAEGTAKGIDASSKIDEPGELRRRCLSILEEYRQPAIVEPYLGGREFTTSIVGTGEEAEVLGTLELGYDERADANAYTYRNKEECETLVHYFLTDEAAAARCAELALRTWRTLGCRDAGRVDFRADESGRLYVLEVNPLPGMHPSHSDLPMTCTAVGRSYRDLIARIVASAEKRIVAGSVLRPASVAS
jgi:D-alanine-D-alanine ligase